MPPTPPAQAVLPLAAALALTLSACAPAGTTGGGFTVSPRRMPAFCAGDASRRFGADLVDVTTGPALREADGYAVNGSFRLTSGDSLRFVCRFDSDGRFSGTTGR